MNIKGMGVALPTQVESSKTNSTTEPKLKAGESSDRDADGRRQQDESHDDSPLTEEQIEKAMEYLRAHAGVKDSGLSVVRENAAGKVLIVLKDYQGNVVRRIPEHQIKSLALTLPAPGQKGQIFHRAM